MPAPGTQGELLRKLEHPPLFWEGQPMPTVEEVLALGERHRAGRAATAPPPPVERPRAYDGDGFGPARDYLDAMRRVGGHLREFADAARREREARQHADAIRAGMEGARADGTGGVQVAQLVLPAAVPPPPLAVKSDAVRPATGQVQLDRAGRRLGHVAGEIARGELSGAAAHLLGGTPYPPEVDDPPLGTLAPLPGFAPPTHPDGTDLGVSIDPAAGRLMVLTTPAAPQAGPEVEAFDPPATDPAAIFERSELRRTMEEAGNIEKRDSRVAHHIVPGSGPMSGGRDAGPTQRRLDTLGIGRNDADKGVALSPGFHARIHTKGYCNYIERQFLDLPSKEDAEDRLRTIGEIFKRQIEYIGKLVTLLNGSGRRAR